MAWPGNPCRLAVCCNVEEVWRIVDHALKGEMPVHGWKPRRWGQAHDALVALGAWRNPTGAR